MSQERERAETTEETGLRAAYEDAFDSGQLDDLDEGGLTRRVFRAGWIAGRTWERRQQARVPHQTDSCPANETGGPCSCTT